MADPTLTFGGTLFSGTVVDVSPGPMVEKSQRHELFGLIGGTEIVGGAQPSEIRVVFRVTGFSTAQLLNVYLRSTLPTIANNTSGTLLITGTAAETYTNCVLREVGEVDYHGQRGPLPNNLDNVSNPWTCYVLLVFHQLQ